MSLNFGGPRGPFPGPAQIGTPPAGTGISILFFKTD